MIEITPYIDESRAEPKYIQIYQHIKQEILNGAIPPGSHLPSIRKLASYLHISRNTVELSYQQLIAEGYVENRPRVGLFAADLKKDSLALESFPQQSTLEEREPVNHSKEEEEYIYDFRHGNIDRTSFPLQLWRKLSNKIFREKSTAVFQYGDMQGELGLREEISRYLYRSRGVLCSPDQIIIGAGIQQLTCLLCQLIGPGQKKMAMENPGYYAARKIFENHTFEVDPIPLEHDGIDLKQLKQSRAKVVYVTPSHQFPYGMVMSISKRMKLLQWAEEQNGLIIEDDYDGEFRYHTLPIPALQGLDAQGSVVYLGTFSKALLPSIRVSYMVLPPSLHKTYKKDFTTYEQTASKLHQMTLELFMREGHWEKHLRKVRKVYQRKHAALLAAIRTCLGNRVNIIGDTSGLHLLVEVNRHATDHQLVEEAKKLRVKVYPTSIYWTNKNENRKPVILLGFGGLEEDQIEEAVGLLKEAWF